METKRFIKFSSIEQFRNTISSIKHQAQYRGKDESGAMIMDRHAVLPTIKFSGTVKMHGANSGVCFNNKDGIWFQSNKRIITLSKDNAKFVVFAEPKSSFLIKSIKEFAIKNNIDLNANTISVFGEWAGGSIQRGVALSNLEKMFVIFAIKVSPHNMFDEDDSSAFWLDYDSFQASPEIHIYKAKDFKTLEIEIDFNKAKFSQNKMIEIMEEVEAECPVGKYFGLTKGVVNTTGEGVVWVGHYGNKRHVFKVKGDKHASSTKVRKIKYIDEAAEKEKIDFANYACKSFRLNQSVQEVSDTLNGGIPTIQDLSSIIKWVLTDVLKEEGDIMTEKGLIPREVNKYISRIVSMWFQDYLEENA